MTPRLKKHTQFKLLSAFYMLLLLACGNDNESVATLGDYDIPMNDSIRELEYTYVTYPHHDTVSVEYVITPEGDGREIKQYNFVNGLMRLERHYAIAGGRKKLLAEYQQQYPSNTSAGIERVPGEIRTFREINDGKKYSALEVEISFTNSIEFRTIVEERSSYQGDTVLIWNGKPVDAIKFQYESSERTFLKYVPFRSHRNDYAGVIYYGKGIGFMKEVTITDGETLSRELVSIEKRE